MKIKIQFPWSTDKEVGETENHYGVPFIVTESHAKGCVMVADLPNEEAQAMIEAGRVVADIPEEDGNGPTRDEMKAYLAEKGVEFPQNIKGDKLAELYAAEKAKDTE